jgi:colicin import membrane protein
MVSICRVTLSSLMLLATVACSTTGLPSATRPEPPAVDPKSILSAVDLSAPMDVDTAKAAIKAAAQSRDEASDAFLRERIACYRRFLVTRCLADVASRQRLVDSRIDAVEVAANQVVRESTALELNRRTAIALEERAAASAAEAARTLDNLKAFEARIESAEKARIEREREAPELERRAQAARADRERREKENALRRDESATRAAQDAVFAAEREKRLEENQLRLQAREARERAQRDQRLLEEARRREPPSAPAPAPAPALSR